MFFYQLNKVDSTLLGLSYNYGDIQAASLNLPVIDWTLNPLTTQFLLSDSSASIQVREISYIAYPVEFPTNAEYFTQLLSPSSRGTLFYLSPLTYQGNVPSTDSSAEEISFCRSGTLLCSQEQTALTVKPSSSSAEFSLNPGIYSQFTLMVLYKIKSGVINSPVNLVSIRPSLTATFQTNTEITLGGCSLTASFTSGVNQ